MRAASRKHETITGRQALCTVCNEYRTKADGRAMCNLLGLVKVKFLGDSKLDQFLHTWGRVCLQIEDTVSREDRKLLFWKQIKRSEVLNPDIHERMKDDDENKSY